MSELALGVSSSASAVASGGALMIVSSASVSKNLQKLGESRDMYSDTNGDL
jgi:hypothetical protein